MADPLDERTALAGLVAAAAPDALLPDHYGGSRIDGPLSLCAAMPLEENLWVTVIRSPTAGLIAAPLVVEPGGSARRARPGDRASNALMAAFAAPSARFGRDGGEGFVVTGFSGEVGCAGIERPMQVDQTHESVVVGDREVVKWAVSAEPTPAPTLVAHLAEAGLLEMARPAGFLTWRADDSEVLVASAAAYLDGASDGWTWAVGDAGEYATGAGELEPAVSALIDVGHLVADLHAALATPTSVLPTPRSNATSQVREWHELSRSLLDQAVAELDGDEGERLRARVPSILAVFDTLDDVESTPTIPVHGDLHVGQILRWTGGYAVGDFDGNPVLPVAARLAPQPAARDVAGMLQALDHVGRVVSRRVAGADIARVDVWIAEAQATFFDAYRSRLGDRGVSDLLDRRLLLPFRVEQECREFLYAVRHLGRWRYVPDQALQALMTSD